MYFVDLIIKELSKELRRIIPRLKQYLLMILIS